MVKGAAAAPAFAEHSRQGASLDRLRGHALQYSRQSSHRSRWLTELSHLLAFPTVSAEPQHRDDLESTARWLARHLTDLGLRHSRVLHGHDRDAPSVYADWLEAPGKPTVLLYGHFDVQPAGPLHTWHTPPFSPTLIGQNLYARGASDDKGQLFIHLKAVESYLAASKRLPVNVKVWLEGEEEIGSPNLDTFLDRHGARLEADAVLVSDTEMPEPGHPSIVYGLRGNLIATLDVCGPSRNLHAGRYGGTVHNPVQALAEIVAGLHDRDGRIAVPGFYAQVREVGMDERRELRRHGLRAEHLPAKLGVPEGWGEAGYSPFERTTIRPALVVHEVTSSGAGAVIPSRARATIGIRLVPDQDPDTIAHLLRRHIASVIPPSVRVTLTFRGGARPFLIDRNHPAVRAASRAVYDAWGVLPTFLRSGGSIALAEQMYRRLNAPVILLGFGLPDDSIHGPNEKLSLPQFFRGVETIIRFLGEMAA